MIQSKTQPERRPSAIQTLEPFLCDKNFFTACNEHIHTSQFAIQLKQGLKEIEAKLVPIPAERLEQITSRLFLHFRCGENEQRQISAEYRQSLQKYPEDLVCAAYQNILLHSSKSTLPGVSDFCQFMNPELQRRRTIQLKLIILSGKANAHINANPLVNEGVMA